MQAHAIKVLCFARQTEQQTGLRKLHLSSWDPRSTSQAMDGLAKQRCQLPNLRPSEGAGGNMLLSHTCPTQVVGHATMAGTDEAEHQAAAHNQRKALRWHLVPIW